MPEYTHKNHRFGIQTPLGDDVLLLSRFDGDEPISGLFAYTLELLSLNDAIEASSIVGQSVRFWVQHPDDEYRFYQGHVSQFQYIGRDDRLSRYRALVVPWLWFLTLNSDCRIFQNMTLPQIVSKVLKDRGCTDFENSQITGSYTPLEYCVQYNESDFTFISRLMEEAGIFYYFRHDEDRLVLVLADSMAGCESCKDGQVEFTDNLSERTLSNPIWKWVHRYEFRAGKWTHKDFNFKSPRSEMLAEVPTLVDLPGNKKFEVYQYPGRYDQRSDGASYARIRMQAEEAAVDIVDGQSHCRSFSPGVRFTMVKHHSQREQGKSYIVTSVCHSFDASDVFVTGRSSPSRGYSNSFTCIPDSVTFRPPRETPLARVRGPQTAIVVGPKGEEIYTDEFGRVKVQFHWDREGQQNEHSSCWMRVSQVHAGAGWGMMDLPRVGEEVIVSFLEGDPDRPIITGRVYNGDNMPPFSLPAGKTRRGNMTKTYKGAGYNEMSMDDTPGKEQLRTNAQYDMNSNVNNDQTLDVGKNQTEKVGVDRTREVGSNETVTVGVNKSLKVGSNQTITVGVMKNEMVGVMSNELVGFAKTTSAGVGYALTVGAAKNEAVGFFSAEEVGLDKTVLVGNNQSHTIGNQCSLDVGTDLKITAGSKIEIACGGCSIIMDAGGKMTINASSECVINGGGATIVMKGGIIDLN